MAIRTRRAVRTIVVLAVMTGVLSTLMVRIEGRQADALSPYDQELLALINEHRATRGLGPLLEYGALSDAALSWSESMRAARDAIDVPDCQAGSQLDAFLVHDSESNIASQGVPPGTTASSESIGWSCGLPGFRSSVNWSYGAMPATCLERLDFTKAIRQFCGWMNNATDRANLESGSFTYIGLGTATRSTGLKVENFATARFAAGPQLPTCDGTVATIDMNTNGGNGSGTAGDDVILGTAGDDVIYGNGGNDKICAGAGRDRVRGGDGDDIIHGGSEVDKIWGDAGNDVIYGDGGSDRIRAGSGADIVWAGSGADRVWGGSGNDTLNGMGGQDTMWGEDGMDILQGNFQSDWLYGGADNDTILGAGGKDKLFGGYGDDELLGGDNTDFLDGGPGTDIANGGRGKDNPLVPNVSGCLAETTISC